MQIYKVAYEVDGKDVLKILAMFISKLSKKLRFANEV